MSMVESGNARYFLYWGKTSRNDSGTIEYHLLPYHCLDVAAVVYELMNGSHKLAQKWARRCGITIEQIQYLCIAIFIFHDIGKFSLTFQSLVPQLYTLLFPGQKPRSYPVRHDSLGLKFWKFYGQRLTLAKNSNMADFLEELIRAALGHHGMPPEEISSNSFAGIRGADSYFNKSDIEAASQFWQDCLELLPMPNFPAISASQQEELQDLSWTVAGIGTIADWIASDRRNFGYISTPIPLCEYWNNYAKPRAHMAVAKTGWNVCPASQFSSFADLFPAIAKPTPLQKKAAEIKLLDGPQLFIIEDATGSGKTEAAIALASRLLSEGRAEGLYIALPTMATANAMFSRMGEAYRRLFQADSHPSLILAHSARHLSAEFDAMLARFPGSAPFANQEGISQAENAEEAKPECNSWYADNRKKALLADIGVGTIDQALLAILPVRHQSMRFVGLENKVLIVDEVHAYDKYTGTLLETLLRAHAHNGGSAILLSATIPAEKKTNLIKAYYSGLSSTEADFTSFMVPDFPLLTQVNRTDAELYPVKGWERARKTTSVSFISTYDSVLAFIKSEAEKGKCICWIRDTVNDARKAYRDLAGMGIAKDKIDLFHSRFAMVDRTRIEQKVIRLFGKYSGSKERQGRVLIATQVVEQSLDLDFDELVSDLAPIDLIIQRAGRLHRHIRTAAGDIIENGTIDERGQPFMHIFAPPFKDEPDSNWFSGDFSGALSVYLDAENLWLSEKILLERGKFRIPDDARDLIDAVYSSTLSEMPKILAKFSVKATADAEAKLGMALLNTLHIEYGYCRKPGMFDIWDEDECIPTRIGAENKEIVLAVDACDRLIPYARDELFPWDQSSLSVSLFAWKQAGYQLPSQFEDKVKKLRDKNPRLANCEIVIVSRQTDNDNNNKHNILSGVYNAETGWGK